MATVTWGGAAERGDLLTGELDRLTPLLRALPGVRRAWVFGSLAAGTVHAGSDLDLLVERDTDEPFLDRAITLVRELRPAVTVDVFVYTPAEVAAGGSFVSEARRKGRELW